MGGLKLVYYIFAITVIACGLCPVSSESGFFWHVTDFHYDPTYWTTQLSCNDPVPIPGKYGDYWCDSNWELVSNTIESMASTRQDVDFVIWTGDSVAHFADKDTSLAANMEILKNVTDKLKSVFPVNTKVYPSLGNHDFYPSDQADVKQDDMYNQTADIWKVWITDADELKRFMQGGFFSMSLSSKLRILSLNTNFYYTHNKITKGMSDPAGQFAWMKSVLDKARQDGQKVIVTAHVTPGVLTPNYVTWMYTDHQEKYVSILTDYSDIIVASHYGHDHSDGFKIMQDKKNVSRAITQFVAPSVTPWRFRAGKLVGNPHNPGFRLVEYDRLTGKHMNYVQYFINLTDTNANNTSQWTTLYDFKKTYQVSDMSVDSLRKIFDNIMSENGQKFAQEYCNNALVSKHKKVCTEKNRYEIVCGGKFYELGEAKQCLHNILNTASVNVVQAICLILPLLLILFNFIF